MTCHPKYWIHPRCLRFSATVPDTTATTDAANASAIAPDANFLPSGLKLYNELFKTGNIKNMDDKYKTDTTPAPDASNDAYIDTPQRWRPRLLIHWLQLPIRIEKIQTRPLLHQQNEK